MPFMECIACKKTEASKVLYAGFPMRFCADCHNMWGFWSFIPVWFGFNGMLFFYSGGYLAALWFFMFGKQD